MFKRKSFEKENRLKNKIQKIIPCLHVAFYHRRIMSDSADTEPEAPTVAD